MKILHIMKVRRVECNGVATSVLSQLKYENKIEEVALFDLNNNVIDEYEYPVFNIKKYSTISSLPNNWNKPDLVIFNEIYKKEYLFLYKECLKNNIPYIIIPHGGLVKKAQHTKFLKKKLANIFLFNKFIKKARAIQFLNNQEKDSCTFKVNKYIISGNGIEINNIKHNQSKKNNIVFIGRLSYYTKGLDLLIKAVNSISEHLKNNKIKINLYGNTYEKDLKKIEKLINKYNLKDIIIINKPIFNKEKTQVLKNASVFIQTSRHEGQPMGIIEALSYGVPCIVTYQTSFGSFVNDHNCGIGVNCNYKEIANAIINIFDMRLDEMSNNAKNCVKREYDWNIISQKCLKEYEVIL